MKMVRRKAKKNDNIIVDRISNFVESIRMAEEETNNSKDDNHMIDTEDLGPGFSEAKRRAKKAILDVERFKANIAEPDPGRKIDFSLITDANRNSQDIGTGVSDDDFFHLTCHIEPSIVAKIEKGEFVDLEKLLPKDGQRRGSSEDN